MEFKEGYFTYEVHFNISDFSKYDWSIWDDGFLTFSNFESRLDKQNDANKIPSFLSGGNQKTANGYLMELDLWRAAPEGIVRELVLEREGVSFLVQDWTLCRKPPEGEKPNCYFTEATTRPIKNKDLFKDLHSYEIVCPEHRLHVFLTIGGKKI